MREFILKKDLWTLDLFSSIVFALAMCALVQIGGDSGEVRRGRILFSMFLGFAMYIATFVTALLLRKSLPFFRSWMWMGIIATLFYLVTSHVIYLPSNWNYFILTSPTVSLALKNALLDTLASILMNWIVWTILACGCIFIARFIAYFVVGERSRG